jgi:chromosome segregation ATPase
VLGTAGLFLFGDHAGSYFTTVSNQVRESVKDKIPVEFEIKRAEKLIRQIDPEIDDCRRDVAQAEVELDHLIRQVAQLKEKVALQERELKMGAGHLTNAKNSSFETPATHYSRRRVELKLERTFESFKNNQAILKTKSALIERQTMAVGASRVKLDSVRARKAELENTIAALKVQKQHLDALAATNRRFDLDDSALAQATEVLAEVKKRLDVTQKMIDDEIFFTDGDAHSPTGKADRDIIKEISQHFGTDQAPGLTPRNPTAETPSVVLSR